MKYIETENMLNEIDWDDGRKFKCHPYWNDDTSFALDIGDGELIDKEGNSYFIHCEYNCDNGMWHYIFEIWFENDSCSIYDIPKTNRSKYLSETELEELRGIIYNLCKDKINTEGNNMDIEKMMIDFILHKANDEQIEQFFGYAKNDFSKEDIEDNLSQMPDDVFDELMKEFELPTDGVKL